jgi:Spy/CpxP family protein refolding chaperone
MTIFTKFAAPLAIAAASLTIAGTAQAQPYSQQRGQDMRGGWNLSPARGNEIRQDINQLNNAIDRAAQRRTISQREAQNLRRQARDVQRLYAQYQRGGLDRNEVRNLQQRVNAVRVALRMDRRDWDGRPG